MANIILPTFSISYFGTYPAEYAPNKYELLFKSAEFADKNGFEALWIPERHFHPFGGFSPNPSVLAGALSRVTNNVQLRAGSVVLPLHHPARIVEEWSVVDNCSGGRVGLAFASGWHPNDFVLTSNDYKDRRETMLNSIEIVRSLWRGETLPFKDVNGKTIDVSIHPRPLQKELPLWVAVLGNPESYAKAGELGVGILTNLIVQDTKQLEEGIRVYKQSLEKHGHSKEKTRITVLLHSFVGKDKDEAIEIARKPIYDYLSSSMQLFQKTHADQENATQVDRLSEDDKEFVFGRAYARYVKGHSLIGNAQSCLPTLKHLTEIGVTEFAAFIDFGVEPDLVYDNLANILTLKEQFLADFSPSQEKSLRPNEYQKYVLKKPQSSHPQLRLDIKGNFNSELFKKCLTESAQQHEALCCRFSEERKSVLAHKEPLIEITSQHIPPTQEQSINDLLKEERKTSFPYSGPLLKASVFELSSTNYVVSLTASSLACDVGSLVSLMEDVSRRYNSDLANEKATLKHNMPLSEYIKEKNSQLSEEQAHLNEKFWKNQFKDYSSLYFNKAYYAKSHQKSLCFEIPQDLWSSLTKAAIQEKCTLFMVLFSAYAQHVQKTYKQDDIIISTPAGNRKVIGETIVIGNITYQLPIRIRNHTIASDLNQIKSILSDVFEHYNVPPDVIEDSLGKKSVQLFAFEMDKHPNISFQDAKSSYEIFTPLSENNPVRLSVIDKGAGKFFQWAYHHSHTCTEASIRKQHEHFLNVLKSALEDQSHQAA